MINVVGSTPQPAAPLPPDLPGELPTDPTHANTTVAGIPVMDQTAGPVNIDTDTTASGNTPPPISEPPKKKTTVPTKSIVAGLVLLLLVIGSGVGLYLMKLNQDLRQQASVYDRGGSCSGSSGGNCPGKSPGAQCGNNAPFGTCRALNNQADDDGGIPCTCDRPDDDTVRDDLPTPTPTRAPLCTQIAGECLNASGACVSYTDGCQQSANCAQPVQSCSLTPSPTPTDVPVATPTPTDVPGDDSGDDPTPTHTPTPTPTTGTLADAGDAQSQPTLPSELPQTGPEDWLKYLQIGLGVLGAGALLLLFL